MATETYTTQDTGEVTKVQVLIIGAGPVGLATGIELASRGIRCMIVERNRRVGYAPRAKTTNVRTREHLRRWGIADKLAAAAPFGVDYPSDIHFVTKLAGKELYCFKDALYCSPQRDPRYSEHSQWIPQYKVEQVMEAHAATLTPLTLCYGEEMLDFRQDADKVRVRIRNVVSIRERTVEADYLIGADGARSMVRDQIGAQMKGIFGLSRNYNIIFEAPGLADAHPHGPGIMYWQINDEHPSGLGPMDSGDLWYFMPTRIPENIHVSKDEASALIREATGFDRPFRVKSSDEWIANRVLATSYHQGRVFLAGDACHLHPPFGGFGMNMGVADGVDIGWKIAAVLQGWGGPELLASYEAERRPVHDIVLDEAVSNHAVLSNDLTQPHLADDTPEGAAARARAAEMIRASKHREFYALSVILGYSYAGSPIIATEAGAVSAGTKAEDYIPDSVPGSLAPHAWLGDQSLYDLFGQGFTLLVLGGTHDDIDKAKADAANARIPLTVVERPEPELQRLYQTRLALIRPDQHVAWRGNSWPGAALLAKVAGWGAGG